MARKSIFVAVIILALATIACGLNINIPAVDVKVGPTQTEAINVEAPSSGSVANLKLSFAAGKLTLAPGAENGLVSGTATYNVADLKPQVSTNGNSVTIQTGDLKINGIPNFGKNYKNEWDLKLGSATMNLVINAGAYDGNIDLGGLSLQSLDVTDGAANADLGFSSPNKTDMASLRYETGASSVKLTGLGNANFSEMTFKSGAGNYTLDFSGSLKRDATVDVQSGVSQLVIVVPEGVSARVAMKSGLSNVTSQGNWQKSGSDYVLSGRGPALTISVSMGAGNLELRNR
ncbi:MAG TPA: toast rack family protein [Anaerolineales bacterium]